MKRHKETQKRKTEVRKRGHVEKCEMVLEKQNRGDTWKEMLGAQVETHSWEEVLHDRGQTYV